MKWALISAFINVVFMVDFLTVAFCGNNLADLLFGVDNAIVSGLVDSVPGMTPWEFFLANAVILAVVTILLFVSIYAAFSERSKEICGCSRETSCPGQRGSA